MTNDPKNTACPDCEAAADASLDRRDFMKGVGAATIAAVGGSTLWAVPKATAAPTPYSSAETAVKGLYETLTDEQKKEICFDWDYQHPKRGLLRTHVSNNWSITAPHVESQFFTKAQKSLIHDVFKSLFDESWYEKIVKQLKDDTGGKVWGAEQSVAIFGKPGDAKFEFVMTGRHLTVRADGNSESHVALGGPIFHGHAASGFNEKVGHPGNIFWHQAVIANEVYEMLDGKQRKIALQARRPREQNSGFRGEGGGFPGIPIAELAGDQKTAVKKILDALIEPYRKEDRAEIVNCLDRQGGLDKCSLAFYRDGDLGDDGQWDNWRIEGPSFVWYFRGTPHVHIWVNVADDSSVKLNSGQL